MSKKTKKQPQHIAHLITAKAFLEKSMDALESRTVTNERQCDLMRYARQSMENALGALATSIEQEDEIDVEMMLDHATDQLDAIAEQWKQGEIGRVHVMQRIDMIAVLVAAIIKK